MATIALAPNSGAVGTVVTVTGSGFAITTAVTCTYGGVLVTTTPASPTTDGSGDLVLHVNSFTFVVPASTNGAHTVDVNDGSTDGTADFTVDSAITLGSGGLGKVGATITVTGSGFIGSHALTATMGATSITLLPTSVSDVSGSYSGHFIVPAKASDGNPYTFTVTDGTNPATANFSIVSAISLAPTSGHVGDSSTVTGSGFIWNAGQAITVLTFDSIDILAVVPPTVAVDGSWSQGFTVPTDSKGHKTVVADDISGEGSPSADYLVAPAISVSPIDATVGTAGVTVTGTGFTASTAISAFTFDGVTPGTQTVTTQTTDLTGGFTGTFTVPAHAAGLIPLVVGDAVPDSASTTFTVDPKITVAPTHAIVGTAGVTVTGSGFTASDAIATITLGGVTPGTETCTTQTVALNGSWSGTFTVPATGQGIQTLEITDVDETVDTNFTVDSHIVLTPNGGAVLNSIAIDGTGFTPSDDVTVTFDTVPIATTPATLTVGLDGSFSGHFVVPAHGAGIITVEATDAHAGDATVNFTVIPELAITPNHATVGTAGISVVGSGFTAADTISAITIGGVVPATETCTGQVVAADGSWSGTFTVPAVSGGSVPVAITDAFDGTVNSGMTIDPAIIVAPTHATVGTAGITVTGSGYTNAAVINAFTLGGITPPTNTVIGQVVAADGSWSGTFTLFATAGGTDTLTAADATPETASTTFGIDSKITVAPATGTVGTAGVVVTGSGFGNTQAVTTFHFNGATPATQTVTAQTTSAVGAFTGTFTVPHAAAGAEPVFAQDASGKSASVNFTVLPKITLSPSATGHVAATITVQGTGFTAAEHISAFTFDGVTPPINTILGGGGALVGATGNWSGTFVVPAHARATVVVAATDGSEGPINTNFVITPNVILTPSSGLEGATITATGSGFTAADPILIFTVGGVLPFQPIAIVGQVVLADGSWTGTFEVPILPGGVQPVHTTTAHDNVTVNFNEVVVVTGVGIEEEEILDSNGDVMWTVTHALTGIKTQQGQFQDELVILAKESDSATDTYELDSEGDVSNLPISSTTIATRRKKSP
jgi:hypothetical protein